MPWRDNQWSWKKRTKQQPYITLHWHKRFCPEKPFLNNLKSSVRKNAGNTDQVVNYRPLQETWNTAICSDNLGNTELGAATPDVLQQKKETCTATIFPAGLQSRTCWAFFYNYRQKYYSQLKQWKQQRHVGMTVFLGHISASKKPDLLAQVTSHAQVARLCLALTPPCIMLCKPFF